MNAIPVRRPDFDFSAVPRDWAGGDQRMTHVINALGALFPDGERFFVRSVAHYRKQITDPVLAERIQGFFGQEVNHGRAHTQAFEMLETQGYRIKGWLKWYREFAYARLEKRLPPPVRLATTVALEHLTATLAEVAFDDGDIVGRCHPEKQRLLRWHAAEEIEHKSVAFDVLTAVDPRYRVRATGFVLGVGAFFVFGMSAARHLAKQDGLRWAPLRMITEALRRPRVVWRTLQFLRPGFHPDQHDNYGLARDWLGTMEWALDES